MCNSPHIKLDLCTHQDFLDILSDLEDFWGSASERARRVHHPMFVHEFGDTAWVVREEGRVIAYLFGFWSPDRADRLHPLGRGSQGTSGQGDRSVAV
jgi:hypothetical protein